MIQGLGMDGRGWALQRGAFGRSHRCIALDNRGTGHSDAPPGPYDLSRMAAGRDRRCSTTQASSARTSSARRWAA